MRTYSILFSGTPSRLVLGAMVITSLVSLRADGVSPAGAPDQAPAKSEAVQTGQKLSIAFSDPSKPGLLKINLMAGGMRITGYEGKEVVIDVRQRDEEEDRGRDRDRNSAPPGLRRIPNRGLGLVVEEEHNEMRISQSMPNRTVDVVVQVPTRTSLKLSALNSGDVTVERVDGDIEVNNVNGGVTLTNVSGAVIAHALNDDLKVSLLRVSDKPMSFSSLNGDLDITLPSTVKANVRMETAYGDVYTDFAVDLQPSALTSKQEDNRGKGGKYRLEIDKAMTGKINGGGPEIRFKTFNGDIKLHKGA